MRVSEHIFGRTFQKYAERRARTDIFANLPEVRPPDLTGSFASGPRISGFRLSLGFRTCSGLDQRLWAYGNGTALE